MIFAKKIFQKAPIVLKHNDYFATIVSEDAEYI